jgi:glycine cleavage system H protein
MSDVPSDRRYTDSHEWIRSLSDGSVRIGITDHAQEALGEIVYVELPEPGAILTRGEGVAVVESVKAASDIYAPLDGEVIEANTQLSDNPELINDAPYEAGWLMRVRPANPADLEQLLDAAGYERTLES